MNDTNDMAQEFNDRVRLGVIMDEFAQTQSGQSLLDFARSMEIDIVFNRSMPGNIIGIYNNNGCVMLDPAVEDGVLIGALAHELHHARQEAAGLRLQSFRTPEEGGEIFPVRDPVTHFYLNRLQEAGAFAFQMEFSRDHAMATGNARPAAFFKKLHPEIFSAYVQTLRGSNGDRALARHAAFTAFIDKSACYDDDTFSGLRGMLDSCRKIAKNGSPELQAFLQEERKVSLDAKTIAKFGEMDHGQNFLAGHEPRELTSEKYLGVLSPETRQRLDAIARDYRRFFDAPATLAYESPAP